jgi:hypothetical protein
MLSNRFSALRRLPDPAPELEIVFKSAKDYQAVDVSTGEFITGEFIYKKGGTVAGTRQAPSDGFTLVDRFSLQTVAKQALPGYRVAKCLRAVVSKNHHISVYKNVDLESIFFGGLQTCGSVWHCPSCAAKISERRSEEVQQAINYCLDRGGFVSFVTRTVPHAVTDSLLDILTRFRQAEANYKHSRHYKATVKNFGSFGQIKVFEITVGLNGWHLHVHEIMLHEFVSITNVYTCLENNLYRIWSDAAVKAGFDEPSRAHGLQVQNGDFAAAYLAKFAKQSTSNWNVSREMTKQHIKKSKSGFSPFDLLRAFRDDPKPEYLELIKEYGQVMHGARQLIWSRGLKALVALEEVTDKEIAENIEAEAVLAGLISLDQWRFIIKHDLRATVLLLVKKHDFAAMVAFLDSLGCPVFQNH